MKPQAGVDDWLKIFYLTEEKTYTSSWNALDPSVHGQVSDGSSLEGPGPDNIIMNAITNTQRDSAIVMV